MKAIKTLLAASVIAAAGTTQSATVATWSSLTLAPTILIYDAYGPYSYVESFSGSGSAALDDSGTFTITAHAHIVTDTLNVFANTDIDLVDTLTGTWNGTTFTATGGTRQYTGCVNNPPTNLDVCYYFAPSGELQTTVSDSITLAGGSVSATNAITDQSGLGNTYPIGFTTYHFDFGAGTPTPSVSIPGAAWLFGSGLLGIAGAAKRKRI